MEIRLSLNLDAALPTLWDEIHETTKIARKLDQYIGIHDLYIEARCHRFYGALAGQAWPEMETDSHRHGRILHRNGKITLSIGIRTQPLERVAVIAHELRHIGQFHQGLWKYNEFGAEWMGRKCEADARAFEKRVQDRYIKSDD
jgi:hypothetical protein